MGHLALLALQQPDKSWYGIYVHWGQPETCGSAVLRALSGELSSARLGGGPETKAAIWERACFTFEAEFFGEGHSWSEFPGATPNGTLGIQLGGGFIEQGADCAPGNFEFAYIICPDCKVEFYTGGSAWTLRKVAHFAADCELEERPSGPTSGLLPWYWDVPEDIAAVCSLASQGHPLREAVEAVLAEFGIIECRSEISRRIERIYWEGALKPMQDAVALRDCQVASDAG